MNFFKKLGEIFYTRSPRIYKIPGDYPVKENGFPFRMNPVQSYFCDKYSPERNAIVESGTGTGKTNIAWLASDNFLKKGKRVIYLAPNRALVYEKFKEATNLWGKRIVGLKTGEKRDLQGDEYVVVTTPESYLSAIRRRDTWTEASLVISDEIQFLIDPSRGSELDIALTISRLKNASILGLSGFLPQKEKIAKWLKGDLFVSNWNNIKRYFTEIEVTDEARFETLEKLLEKHKGQFIIVFVPTIKTGHELSEDLSVPFHYRDLPKERREEIEEAFRKGDVKVIVSTPTLAYGVNTPADVVVIYGIRRGWDYLSKVDVIQEIGRAGRYPKKEAFCYIMGDKIELYHAHSVQERDVRLSSMESLIMTRLMMGGASIEDLHSLAMRTYSAQGKRSKEVQDSVYKVCKYLINHSLAKDGKDYLAITGEGAVLARFYLSPLRYINFLKVARPLEKSDIFQPLEKGCIALAELMQIPFIEPPKGLHKSFQIRLVQAEVKGKAREAAFLKGVLTGTVKHRPPALSYCLKDTERWFSAFADFSRQLGKDDIPMVGDIYNTWKNLKIIYMKNRQMNLFEE